MTEKINEIIRVSGFDQPVRGGHAGCMCSCLFTLPWKAGLIWNLSIFVLWHSAPLDLETW